MRKSFLRGATAVLIGGLVFAPVTASATWTVVCGNNGTYWIDTGAGHFIDTEQSCGGPIAAVGNGGSFTFIISDRIPVSAQGRSVLADLEKRAVAMSPKRARTGSADAAPKRSGRVVTIYIKPTDVGPRLAALLTKLDPNWKTRDRDHAVSPSSKHPAPVNR